MNEKIIIKGFSVIDEVEIDIKKINILIGPQTAGKSLIAKLVYFFKTINYDMQSVILSGEGKRKFDSRVRERFNRVFPGYLSMGKVFSVTYYYGENFITITNEKAKTYKSMVTSYSEDILKEFYDLRRDYKSQVKDAKFVRMGQVGYLDRSIEKSLHLFLYGTEKLFCGFIHAGRSFFANIRENIFSILTRSASIDYMLIEFGSFFEKIKKEFRSLNAKKDIDRNLYRLCSKVLGGEYECDNDNEWIRTKGNQPVLLRDSSSGQREVAPLIVSLMVLSTFPDSRFSLFIEEPESQLFPGFQRKIVEIIAMVYNLLKRNSGFFITTHSPYILTTLNILIQAENGCKDIRERFDKGKTDEQTTAEKLKKLDKIIPRSKRMSFDDLSVYMVKGGRCKDIRNKENKLIDGNIIDEVSDTTASIFDQLLDISYGD